MTREFSGELVIDDEKLKAHGKIVMDALGAAVECLDDSTQLTSLLISVGERHALYGVQADMVPVCKLPIIIAYMYLRVIVLFCWTLNATISYKGLIKQDWCKECRRKQSVNADENNRSVTYHVYVLRIKTVATLISFGVSDNVSQIWKCLIYINTIHC